MASLHDRIEGVLLGTAAGDALGAPYEFGPPRGPELEVAMKGGGPWAPGEWTDDTAMAIAIGEAISKGGDARDEAVQDTIVARWLRWSLSAKDVGIQTRSVLSGAARGGISAERARAEAAKVHQREGRSGGNGSLMRTAPLALAYLDDERALVEAARAISELTHFDPDAGDACVLWSVAIRHAVLTAELDVRVALRHLDPDRQQLWSDRLDIAESSRPADIDRNGWTVAALQAAWSAIVHTVPGPEALRADHLRLGLDAAVRAGNDTDTVAAIAGSLLGAAYGASAVPLEWRQLLHGWPGMRAHDLVNLAAAIARGGEPDLFDFSYWDSPIDTFAIHPHDDKVFLGGIGVLRDLPDEVDAVVSLCRVANTDIRDDMPHVEVRLVDQPKIDENPHLDFVLTDAARAVERLRDEGRTVLLHCVAAHSRTPTVAALYGARRCGISTERALRDIQSVLPRSHPNPAFRAALKRLDLTTREGEVN